MLLDFILISLTLLVLFIASYADIKTKEVPDWLNYGFIFAVLGIRTIFSLELGADILISGILGFAICFLIALLFSYTNQWGGGDSKLLMGMGAVIGIEFPFSETSFTLLWFFLALLLLGGIYGLLWMVFLAIKKKEEFMAVWQKKIRQYFVTHFLITIASIFFIISVFFYPFLWPLILFPPIVFYLIVFINAVEESCFLIRKNISDLTEGDWLAEDVKVNTKIVLSERTLEKVDLKKLYALLYRKQVSEVLIKEGVPFVPSFLLAYLAILFGKTVFAPILTVIFN